MGICLKNMFFWHSWMSVTFSLIPEWNICIFTWRVSRLSSTNISWFCHFISGMWHKFTFPELVWIWIGYLCSDVTRYESGEAQTHCTCRCPEWKTKTMSHKHIIVFFHLSFCPSSASLCPTINTRLSSAEDQTKKNEDGRWIFCQPNTWR